MTIEETINNEFQKMKKNWENFDYPSLSDFLEKMIDEKITFVMSNEMIVTGKYHGSFFNYEENEPTKIYHIISEHTEKPTDLSIVFRFVPENKILYIKKKILVKK